MISETALRSASRKLTASAGIETVILFGSRARGEAHPESDTDLVLATSGPSSAHGPTIAQARRLIPNSDIVWFDTTDPTNLDHGLTIWPRVIRDGVVLAGNPDILANLRNNTRCAMNKAAWPAMIQKAIDEVAGALRSAAEREASAGDTGTMTERSRRRAWIAVADACGTERSTRAAEMLSRLALGAFGVDPGRGHDPARDYKDRLEHVTATNALEPGRRKRIHDLLKAIDANVNAVRNAVYEGKGEPAKTWIRRTQRTCVGLIELLDNTDREAHDATWFQGIHGRAELDAVRGWGGICLAELEGELRDRHRHAVTNGLEAAATLTWNLIEILAGTSATIRDGTTAEKETL